MNDAPLRRFKAHWAEMVLRSPSRYKRFVILEEEMTTDKNQRQLLFHILDFVHRRSKRRADVVSKLSSAYCPEEEVEGSIQTLVDQRLLEGYQSRRVDRIKITGKGYKEYNDLVRQLDDDETAWHEEENQRQWKLEIALEDVTRRIKSTFEDLRRYIYDREHSRTLEDGTDPAQLCKDLTKLVRKLEKLEGGA